MTEPTPREQLSTEHATIRAQFTEQYEALCSEYGCGVAGSVVVTPDGRLAVNLYITDIV